MSEGTPRSFQQFMSKNCPDRKIWIESYLDEVEGLKEQDTYIVINEKEHHTNYPEVQVIPSMSVQTVKQDDRGDPVRAKTRVVALGNFEDIVWEKSNKYTLVLRDESSQLMTSMAVENGRREKQGDYKNAFVQSYLPDNEKIIVRPPKGCPISKAGDLWLLKKTGAALTIGIKT
jgi:hypothetical protein